MNSKSIYERKIKGLDNSVWLFMCITMLLSMILLTSFLLDRKNCIPFTFKITPKTDSGYYTEKNLSFSLSTSAKNVTWDFGDGTPVKTGVYVSHEYHKAGKFNVTVSIKEGCEETQEITVKKSLLDHSTGNEIEGPVTIAIEKEAEFNCSIYGSSWRWEVMDHPEIKANTEKLGTAKFRFTNGGTYYVQVILDDDRTKSYTKEIVVTDSRVKPKSTELNDIKPIFTDQRGLKKPEPTQQPQQPQETKTGITYISNKSFKDLLDGVISDDNSSKPLIYFDKFLNNGKETTVKIEGSSSMSFNKFYNFLKNNGSLIITNVILARDPEQKVMFISVTFSK